ncbi:50S ribosomal protein L23 [Candidatus Peregrinibacteria bacterium]|nr:50S ribosomal protein L23 [Candidatus Peregrinibacteria bacterium]
MKYTKILKPIVTEKATRLGAAKQYTFWVTQEATKVDVADAFRELYGEKPRSINIINVDRKIRLVGRGRTMMKRPYMKKAIIRIDSKKGIDVNKIKFEEKK